MNKPLLEQVIKHIEEEPRRLLMDTWLVKLRKPETMKDSPPCGTIGCIAGWSIFLSGNPQPYHSYSRAAAELLDITTEEADVLFYADSWPSPFVEDFFAAVTKHKKAEITVARIRHFMETGE